MPFRLMPLFYMFDYWQTLEITIFWKKIMQQNICFVMWYPYTLVRALTNFSWCIHIFKCIWALTSVMKILLLFSAVPIGRFISQYTFRFRILQDDVGMNFLFGAHSPYSKRLKHRKHALFFFGFKLSLLPYWVHSFSCCILAKACAGAVCYIGVKRAFAVTLNEVL